MNVYWVKDIFHQNSFAEINSVNSKLRTYKLFKTSIKQEPYLTEIKNVKDRIIFSKFRLSNHELMIEKGRHLNINKELRFCKFCPGSIEDEIHFLTKCKTYSIPRKIFMDNVEDNVRSVRFREMSDEQIFIFLLTNTSIISPTGY